MFQIIVLLILRVHYFIIFLYQTYLITVKVFRNHNIKQHKGINWALPYVKFTFSSGLISIMQVFSPISFIMSFSSYYSWRESRLLRAGINRTLPPKVSLKDARRSIPKGWCLWLHFKMSYPFHLCECALLLKQCFMF